MQGACSRCRDRTKQAYTRRFKRKADDTLYFDGPGQDYDLSQFVPLEVRSLCNFVQFPAALVL